jgi:AcrR family transcriptional regulator
MTEYAGKTRGSFYHHFESRDAFLEALIEDWQASSLTALSERLQKAEGPDAQRAIMRKVSMEWDGSFERELRYLAAQEPSVAQLLAKVDELRIQGLASMIRLLRPDVEDADALAFVQYASVVGGQMLLKSGDDPRIPAIWKVGNQLFDLS